MYKDATIRSGDTSNPSEIEIKDILFDTGASHSSYISKDLVDKYRSEWKDKIRPVEARVTLADNTTQIPIIEEIELDMTFYYDANSGTAQACVWMFIINSPGKTIIIGLPDIVVHFYYLFTEMVNIAREDYRRIQRKEEKGQLTNNVSSLKPIDLQLPIEGLEEPFIPWEDNPWVIAQEEIDTYDPCSFTGPLAYLTMSHEEAIENYLSLLNSHISPEFMAECPKVLDLMKS
jgi:hypothetical protein